MPTKAGRTMIDRRNQVSGLCIFRAQAALLISNLEMHCVITDTPIHATAGALCNETQDVQFSMGRTHRVTRVPSHKDPENRRSWQAWLSKAHSCMPSTWCHALMQETAVTLMAAMKYSTFLAMNSWLSTAITRSLTARLVAQHIGAKVDRKKQRRHHSRCLIFCGSSGLPQATEHGKL